MKRSPHFLGLGRGRDGRQNVISREVRELAKLGKKKPVVRFDDDDCIDVSKPVPDHEHGWTYMHTLDELEKWGTAFDAQQRRAIAAVRKFANAFASSTQLDRRAAFSAAQSAAPASVA